MFDNIKLQNLSEIVQSFLEKSHCGHDYFHVLRVAKLAEKICSDHPTAIDRFSLLAAALVHDICRPFEKITGKSHFGDEALVIIGVQLKNAGFDSQEIIKVTEIVKYHDIYDLSQIPCLSEELKIHQDADRLDAIGAIGIARTFAFGGANGLPLYIPGETLEFDRVFVEDPAHRTSTIAHFYDKLLKLKNQMHTVAGRLIAEERHKLMENYLQSFFEEWNLENL